MNSCPLCGSAVTYRGLTSIECAGAGCANAGALYVGPIVDVADLNGTWIPAAAGVVSFGLDRETLYVGQIVDLLGDLDGTWIPAAAEVVGFDTEGNVALHTRFAGGVSHAVYWLPASVVRPSANNQP